MKRIIVVFWLFVSNLGCILAQDIVRGRVTSTENHPIEGVSVKDPNDTTLAITDSLGNFILKQPTPDNVVVSPIAYQDRRFKIGLTEAGLVNIVMKPITALLEEVVVSTGSQ